MPNDSARAEFGFPIDKRLIGASVDQVEIDPAEGSLRRVERGQALANVVRPPEEA